MRLIDALRINQQPASPDAPAGGVHLVCGFTPLHLETLLGAYARLRFPGSQLTVTTGLFGDLEGNIRRAYEQPAEGAVVVLEWSDIDERLGLRASAGWSERTLADILEQTDSKLQRLEAQLEKLAQYMPVSLVAPTLPWPPLTYLPPVESGAFDFELRAGLLDFLSRICRFKRMRVVSEAALAAASPPSARRDVKLELHAGFPYSITHADHVARLAIECLFPVPPKKGLITDLDDTLWKGILGEVGTAGVSWCLESKSQAHALYQQALASLAESGVLIAIVSKNDPELVRQALERPDILLSPQSIYPIEASWGAKSEAVGRILKAWNIGADSVVFVDDSPMELAEVADRVPGIEGLPFPTEDPAAILDLIVHLRSRFGKSDIREEDRIRLQSLRSRPEIENGASAEASPDFLARLHGKLTLSWSDQPDDDRAFELVNKTNQFNLNGRRYTERQWQSHFQQPGAFLVTASYEDRFGPLGKIAVLGGRQENEHVGVDFWVMSCRAFSRHIEFQMLRRLYDESGASKLTFAFEKTERNGPLQEFFERFYPSGVPSGEFELPLSVFEEACPKLSHEVVTTNQKWTTYDRS